VLLYVTRIVLEFIRFSAVQLADFKLSCNISYANSLYEQIKSLDHHGGMVHKLAPLAMSWFPVSVNCEDDVF